LRAPDCVRSIWQEFILAMHLTNARVKAGITLPATLPPELLPHKP